jgi:proteasome assembly chaperone (PAC2) family protein
MDIIDLPQLEHPNIIAAFQGWNDAGQAATTAVRYLIDSWHAQKFAEIDPEDYFSFTDTRPIVRIVEGSQRELTWPKNEFFAFSGDGNSPAAVMLVGTEPNLKWRTFCSEIVHLAQSLEARRLVTLGALITDSVHTRPVPLTGFATDESVRQKLTARSISRSSYEGPTGIVGTLHNICLKAGLPTASVWAATPYYLGATPNPKSALSLLDTMDDALNLHLNLSELRNVSEEFERQVSLAVRDNDDVQERIRALEQAYDAGQPQLPQASQELPSAGAILEDLESFLREQQRKDD